MDLILPRLKPLGRRSRNQGPNFFTAMRPVPIMPVKMIARGAIKAGRFTAEINDVVEPYSLQTSIEQ